VVGDMGRDRREQPGGQLAARGGPGDAEPVRSQLDDGAGLEERRVEHRRRLVVPLALEDGPQRLAQRPQAGQVRAALGGREPGMAQPTQGVAPPGQVVQAVRRLLEEVERVDQHHRQVEVPGRPPCGVGQPVGRHPGGGHRAGLLVRVTIRSRKRQLLDDSSY